MTTREAEIIGLIHKEVKPALGCTEPIAVALAAARATELLAEKAGHACRTDVDFKVNVEVSGNIPGRFQFPHTAVRLDQGDLSIVVHSQQEKLPWADQETL